MILFLDTSDYNQATIALIGREVIKHEFQTVTLSEKLPPEIKKFLKKQGSNLRQLKKIAVVVGPGGFSRIRTAVAVANALAYGLKIPVVPITKDKLPSDLLELHKFPSQKMVQPVYDREPNITAPKKK